MIAAIVAWYGKSYWNYSDGVYAYTSRALLDGQDLYGDVAVAQPPLLFYVSALILAIADSVWALRIALGGVSLVTGGLVAVAVWRLTKSQAVAVVAGIGSLVTPWSLHEDLSLTPESFAAPLLLGAALLASGRKAALAGALGGLAVLLKLAFAIPVLALIVATLPSKRFAFGALAAVVSLSAISLVLYGSDLIENVLVAQLQTGTKPLSDMVGIGAQAAWNLVPLLVLTPLAWMFRTRLRDPALLRTCFALLLGELALLITLFKTGSSLSVLAVIEPIALVLAGAGIAASVPRMKVKVIAAASTCVALALAQSVGLVLSPDDPEVFARPLSALAHERTLSSEEVDRVASKVRQCSEDLPYSGVPYVAFVANRQMPGGQPDRFIVAQAETHDDLQGSVDADQPRCP